MRLIDADNPVTDTMATVLIHPELLPIQLIDDQQATVLMPIKQRQPNLLGKVIYGCEVTAKKAQLLPEGFAP
jgi:hypothetical protein